MTKRTEVIQLRVSTEEKERIAENASLSGLKVSDWLRQQGLANYGSLLEPKAHQRATARAEKASVEPLPPDQGDETEPSPQLYRCPVHKNEVRSSPTGRCFCNRKTSEAV